MLGIGEAVAGYQMLKMAISGVKSALDTGKDASNIAQAISAIEVPRENYNLTSASFYLTEPLYNLNQEYFINTVVGLDSDLNPFQLLDFIKSIENMLGRRKTLKRNMPRTIDIDILVHGSSVIETKELAIPHPGLINRKFVLIPFERYVECKIIPFFLHLSLIS